MRRSSKMLRGSGPLASCSLAILAARLLFDPSLPPKQVDRKSRAKVRQPQVSTHFGTVWMTHTSVAKQGERKSRGACRRHDGGSSLAPSTFMQPVETVNEMDGTLGHQHALVSN